MYLYNKRDQTKKLRSDKIIDDEKDFVIKSLLNTQLKDKQDLHNQIVDIICNPTNE